MQQLQKNFIKNLHYYEAYLPKQTFKFKYLDDAYDTIIKIWKHCQYKHLLGEISFKAIIEDFENGRILRITKSFDCSSYGLAKVEPKTNDEIVITDWNSIVNGNW